MSFRIQNKRLMLTYKTHLGKDEYKRWLDDKGKSLKSIYMAHENGDEHHPYPHTHVLLEYEKILQSRNCRYFDYENIHPNIKKIVSEQHWTNSLRYLAKEDPDNASMLEMPVLQSLVSKVISCETEWEAIETYVKKPADYHGIRDMYREQKREVISDLPNFLEKELRGWEKIFLKVNNQAECGRTVNWVYDKRGNGGKTCWGKYLKGEFPSEWMMLTSIGRPQDFAQNVLLAKRNGWNGYGIIVDISRSTTITDDLYSCLENIVDGEVTCTKYNCGTISLGSPKVWVFSNHLPRSDSLSLDRWRVLEIIGRDASGVALRKWTSDYGWDNRVKLAGLNYIPYSYEPVYDTSSSGSLEWHV